MFCVSIIPVSLDVLNHFAQKEITDERQRVKEREREGGRGRKRKRRDGEDEGEVKRAQKPRGSSWLAIEIRYPVGSYLAVFFLRLLRIRATKTCFVHSSERQSFAHLASIIFSFRPSICLAWSYIVNWCPAWKLIVLTRSLIKTHVQWIRQSRGRLRFLGSERLQGN